MLSVAGVGGDPFFSDVESLLYFDGADASTTITDEKGLSWTAFGNAQVDSDDPLFIDTNALLLDGTGDYATTPNAAIWNLGSNNFTLECFVKPNVSSQVRTVFEKRVDTDGYVLQMQADGQFIFACLGMSGGTLLLDGATTPPTDEFKHIAVCREGNQWYLFFDGNLESNVTRTQSIVSNTGAFHIGRDPVSSSRDWSGSIGMFRFTLGVARYTSAFTPPSERFPDF
jgi:hypothetical protein